jgi:FkbM family methyltransferase
MKLKTLITMDYGWAVRFVRKRAKQRVDYYRSKIAGLTYWVNPYGVKLGFITPYHHSLAHSHSQDGHEPEVIRPWAEASKSASLIYDLGGFNGVFGLISAKVNPKAHVIIFEPTAANYDQIKYNIALNKLENCEARQEAVSNFNGTVKFLMNGTSGDRIGKRGIDVPCIRLDSLPQADLIKIDCEGEEGRIIEGADLSNKPVIFLEHHNWLTEPEAMWNRLATFGYSPNPINYERDGVNHLLKAA